MTHFSFSRQVLHFSKGALTLCLIAATTACQTTPKTVDRPVTDSAPSTEIAIETSPTRSTKTEANSTVEETAVVPTETTEVSVTELDLESAAATASTEIDSESAAATTSTETDLEPSVSVASAPISLSLTGDGFLTLNGNTGSTKSLAFGQDIEFVRGVVTRILGAEPEGIYDSDNCPGLPGAVSTIWPSGLKLVSSEGVFKGWGLNRNTPSASMRSMAGIGIGSTRAELETAYSARFYETNLGVNALEFSTGGMSGLLDTDGPNAVITGLWSGHVCIFR